MLQLAYAPIARCPAIGALWASGYSAMAFAQEERPVATEAAPADATAMVAFLFVFIAMIVAYILWIRREQKKQKAREAARSDAG